jgi:hypothetical protein
MQGAEPVSASTDDGCMERCWQPSMPWDAQSVRKPECDVARWRVPAGRYRDEIGGSGPRDRSSLPGPSGGLSQVSI